jgi:hypothetical protein
MPYLPHDSEPRGVQFIDACMANERTATSGSPVFWALRSGASSIGDADINRTTLIDTMRTRTEAITGACRAILVWIAR